MYIFCNKHLNLAVEFKMIGNYLHLFSHGLETMDLSQYLECFTCQPTIKK